MNSTHNQTIVWRRDLSRNRLGSTRSHSRDIEKRVASLGLECADIKYSVLRPDGRDQSLASTQN